MIQLSKFRPKRSLRWILALWFLSFSIFPVIVLTVYSLKKFQQTIDNELVVRLRGNASEIQVILSEYQRSLLQKQEGYLRQPLLSQSIKTRGATLAELLTGWLADSAASSLTVYDREGNLLSEHTKIPRHEESNPNHSARKRVSLNQTIQAQVREKQTLIIPDYSVPQSLSLSLISIVKENKTPIGYLKQSLILDSTFLKKISDRMQIQGILLEPNGRIITGSHPDFLLYKSDFFSEYLKIPKLKTLSLNLRGEPFGFIFTKIPWGNTEFEMALAASKKDANMAIDNLRIAYYTIVGIMFAVLVLSVFAASNVVLRPLSELIEAIQDLHLGENIIELPTKSDNEIGQLTNSFNDLSRRILATQRELRQKIKELEESNAHLKETQAQLVQSAKLASLGQLVAGVAHELNNPIGFIYSNMDHLRDYSKKLMDLLDAAEKDPKNLPQLKAEYDIDYIRKDLPKLIASCEDGARRTKDIVVGLRNFSRLEEKTYRPIDLHQSLDTTLDLLKSEFKDRIEIKKDYGALPLVTCNQTQINQVFMNILSNAAQAVPGRGTVWISTRMQPATDQNPEWVSISIQDSGPGISPDVLQKIFDPFFTTKTVGKGTGLGLAISYGIINAHGGTIKVTSKPGTGTEFIVSLPIQPPSTLEPTPS